jgi:hypothetical protein
MFKLNISDELYTELTMALNETRNTVNSVNRELEDSQVDLSGTGNEMLNQVSGMLELKKAADNGQATIELLNKILRATTHTNSPHASSDKHTPKWFADSLKSKYERYSREGNLTGANITKQCLLGFNKVTARLSRGMD